MEIPMQKPVKKPASKRSRKASQKRRSAANPSPSVAITSKAAQPIGKKSKQAQVIAMLQSEAGATIAAMAQQTGWQPHSVRGFLASVVRKKLKLKLHSSKVDDHRVYRIEGGAQPAAAAGRPSQRRAA
jgi:Protein of unknown function (DUF3489)